MSATPEAIEVAARASAPHLWNGKLESTLLMLTGPVTFTPEQAAEAGEKKRQEQLALAETFLTAVAPSMEAQAKGEALREAADELERECSADASKCFCGSSDWLRVRAEIIEREASLAAAMADPEGRRLADAAVALAKDAK